MKYKKVRLVFAVGGTGGHVLPAKKIAKDLLFTDPSIDIFFVGGGLKDNPYFLSSEILDVKKNFYSISSGSLSRRFSLKYLQSIIKILFGFLSSLSILLKHRPKFVLSFGSYHVFPLLCAAKCLKIPIVLFETNVFPGKVNRLFSKGALLAITQMQQAKIYLKSPVVCVPLPLRRTRDVSLQDLSFSYYGFSKQKMTILIVGGSQGSVILNQLAQNALIFLHGKEVQFQVLHFCGEQKGLSAIQSCYDQHNIDAVVKTFESNMHYAWSIANLGICRAGGGTIGELIGYHVPAILVPYPYASENHQAKNGEFFVNEVCGGYTVNQSIEPLNNMKKYLTLLFSNQGCLLKKKVECLRQFKTAYGSATVQMVLEKLIYE